MNKILMVLVTWGFLAIGLPHNTEQAQGIQLSRLGQQDGPSIEYKYLVKTLLPNPKQNPWWRRGTHRIYATEDNESKIIYA